MNQREEAKLLSQLAATDAESEPEPDAELEPSREGCGIDVDRATALKEMPNAVVDWATQNTGESERVQYNSKDGTLVVNHVDNPSGHLERSGRIGHARPIRESVEWGTHLEEEWSSEARI